MKPKIFIGSSTEQSEVAEFIYSILHGFGEVRYWKTIFKSGRPFLSDLIAESQSCDFAIFVFNPDDTGVVRGAEFNLVRDNVIFEAGLFIGSIGSERTFVVSAKGTHPKIMSDYHGVTYSIYDPSVGSLYDSVYAMCIELKKRMVDLKLLKENTGNIEEKAKSGMYNEMLGLEKVYESYDVAEKDILNDLKTSPGPIRLFLQIATKNLAVKGSLYDILRDLSSKDIEIRILHTDENSPLFAKDRLISIGKDPEEVLSNIASVNSKLKNLANKEGSSIRHRIHHLPFIWRLYAFDYKLYLMPYYSGKEATANSPVLLFTKSESSMYNTFIDWFDSQWEQRAPKRIKLTDLITPATPSGAALFLKWNDEYHVFGIPKRDLDETNHLRFYGIGGKKSNPDESWEECAIREGMEETSGAIDKLVSSSQTELLRSNNVIEQIEIVESNINPCFIYEKRKHTGYGSMYKSDDHYYLVGYHATLSRKPIPSREIGALLFLTDANLRTIKNNINVPLGQIVMQGGMIVEQEGITIDRNKVLVPHGTALYVLRQLKD